jgi:hypothetical protein
MQWLVDSAPWIALTLIIWGVLYFRLRRSPQIPLARLEQLRDEHGRLPAVLHATDPTQPLAMTHLDEGRDEKTGFSYRVSIGAPTESSPAFLVVTLLAAAPGQFMLQARRPEHARHWLERLLPTSTPIPHRALNARFQLWATGELAALLARPACEQALGALAQLGFRTVRKDEKGVDAVWLDYPHGAHVAAEIQEQAVAHLRAIAAEFARYARPRWDLFRRVACLGLPLALGLATIGIIRYSHGRYEPVPSEMPRLFTAGIPFAIVIALGALLIQRHLARGLAIVRWARWMFAAITVVLAVLTGITLAGFLNSTLDRSISRVHICRIAEVSRPSGASGYCADVASWLADGRTERIWLSDEVCDLIGAYQDATESLPALEVTTRPGFLHVEWIVSYGVTAPP